MPFRSAVASPEELARLAAAFDAAWIDINARRPTGAAATAGARERLGAIILKLRESGADRDLSSQAVTMFLSAETISPVQKPAGPSA